MLDLGKLTFTIGALLALSACYRGTPPPPTSAAKFLAASEAQTQLTGSIGGAVETRPSSDRPTAESSTNLYLPVTELSLARSHGPYRWSVTAGTYNLVYEGFYAPVDVAGFEFGLVHGVGVGVLTILTDELGFHPNMGAGLLVGFGADRRVHIAVRYWAGTFVPDGEVGFDIVGTLGFKASDALRIEFAIDHWWADHATPTTYFVGGLTLTGGLL
jgi:hypothetical protein